MNQSDFCGEYNFEFIHIHPFPTSEPCHPMVIHNRITTVMNVGIIIVMNVSCMSHNCHCSTRDTRQHHDTNVTADQTTGQ